MKMNTISQQSASYRMWSEDQCAEIFNATCRVLQRTGCKVENAKARDLLEKAGCWVDGEMVHIPASLTNWAVKSAPSTITMYDRFGKPAYTMAPHEANFGPTNSDTCVWDGATGEKHPATTQDAINYTLLCDALPNIAWASTLVMINDCDARIADIHEVRTLLPLTTKPIMNFAFGLENLKYIVGMAEAVAGSAEALAAKPFLITEVCPVPPLQHTEGGMDQIMYMAEKGLPVLYMPGASLGLAAPITAAGAVTVALADTLAALVVSQLTNEGAPYVSCVLSDNVDMRSVLVSHSRPEYMIGLSGVCDVFRYLDLPFCTNLGATSHGVFDEQAAFDSTVALYTSLLSGTNMSFTQGALESGRSSCVEMLVFADEVLSFLTTITKGQPVNEYTLAEDLIDEVGPGGNFLGEAMTSIEARKFWQSDVLTAMSYEDLKAAPMPTLGERLRARAQAIIEKGPQHPLDDASIAKLDAIVADAKKNICGE